MNSTPDDNGDESLYPIAVLMYAISVLILLTRLAKMGYNLLELRESLLVDACDILQNVWPE